MWGVRVIRTTVEHPLGVVGRGGTDAGQLEPGDLLLGADGRQTAVRSVDGPKASAPVYNLEIEEYRTFLIGRPLWGFSVWAYNEGVICAAGANDAAAEGRAGAAGAPGAEGATAAEAAAPTSGKPLHIDIVGEGRYSNATNVNPNNVTSTTGTPGRPIPNHVPGTGHKLPFGNGVADGISLENAPILPETTAEIARVIKPGGSIRLVSPAEYAKVAHQRVIDAVGGTVVQVTDNGITTTTIVSAR